MKKMLILSAVFVLVASTANGAVFANEGVETPEVAVITTEETPEVETVSVPEGAEAEAAATVAETETVEATSSENEAEVVVEPEEAVSESPTAGYSDELFSVFSKTADIAEAKSKDENYTEDSRNNLFAVMYNARSVVGEAGYTGVLTDAILQQEIDKINLAISQLVLKDQPQDPKPETPKPGEEPKPEQPKPEAPKPGEEPKPEQPKPETPKPGEEPKPEQPKPEAPKPGEEPKPEQPKPEAPKSTLPNTGDAESTAKLKSMTMEKPVSTMPATQSDNKQLPQTGETDSFAIFSAAALTILAGVGMLAYGKREEV
ncbi:LPXTG cell wall anchor domain-containing protein [Aerococcaceae bacterium NML191292]|nr:LPXTG cell wall anchor domain-containing protein [Aerococcaceae bacterium NML191292]